MFAQLELFPVDLMGWSTFSLTLRLLSRKQRRARYSDGCSGFDLRNSIANSVAPLFLYDDPLGMKQPLGEALSRPAESNNFSETNASSVFARGRTWNYSTFHLFLVQTHYIRGQFNCLGTQ